MILFLLFLLIVILNIKSSIKARERAEKLLSTPYTPLPDIIHINFPKTPVKTPDYFLFICICIALLNYDKLENFNKNVLTIIICLFIRTFSIHLTLLPTCMSKPSNSIRNIYEECFLSTHDLMFSGHTLFFICIGNMIDSNFIKFFGPFLSIISRQHYTIDVCVSGLVYFFVYSNINFIN